MADPQSLPVVFIIITHVIRTYIRLSVRPTYQNQARQNKSLPAGLWTGRVDHSLQRFCFI